MRSTDHNRVRVGRVHTPVGISVFLLLPTLANFPDLPEFETLISCTRTNDIAGRAHTAVQHTEVMCISDLSYRVHAGVRVQHDRVGRVAVRGQYLFLVRCPLNGGDLGRCRLGVHTSTSVAIPYVDSRIVRATS